MSRTMQVQLNAKVIEIHFIHSLIVSIADGWACEGLYWRQTVASAT